MKTFAVLVAFAATHQPERTHRVSVILSAFTADAALAAAMQHARDQLARISAADWYVDDAYVLDGYIAHLYSTTNDEDV